MVVVVIAIHCGARIDAAVCRLVAHAVRPCIYHATPAHLAPPLLKTTSHLSLAAHIASLTATLLSLATPVLSKHTAAMAFNTRNHPAAVNGFGPHSLLKHETEALFRLWYPCPLDMRARYRYSIGVAGVLVPDAPRLREKDWTVAVHHHYWHKLTAEQRQQPEWAPSNTD